MITVVVQEAHHVVEVGNPDIVVVAEPVTTVVEVQAGSVGGWPQMSDEDEITLVSNELIIPDGHSEHIVIRGEGATTDTWDTVSGAGLVDNKRYLLQTGGEGITADFETGNLLGHSGQVTSAMLNQQDWVEGWWDAGDSKFYVRTIFPSRIATAEAFVSVVNTQINLGGILRLDDAQVTINGGKIEIVDIPEHAACWLVRPETGLTDDLISIKVTTDEDARYLLILQFVSGETITIKHNDAGGTSDWKFFTTTGADMAFTGPYESCIIIKSQDAGPGWLVFPNKAPQAAFVDPSTADAEQIAQSLINAGLMAAS